MINMTVGGQWTLQYDFGCTGSYNQVGITFNNDGTFSIPSQFFTGKWVQQDGMILFQFDGEQTTYGGNIAGNAMVGIISTFTGSNGCWYAIAVGSSITPAEVRKPEFDASGKKAKQ